LNTIVKTRHRLADEQGYAMLELRFVITIVVLLVAIAVPSYASFGGRASTTAAQANVRMAIPAAASYFNDPAAGANSFNGITGGKLRLQAPGLDLNLRAGPNGSQPADGYCLEDTANGATYHYEGGISHSSTIVLGTCPTAGYASVA
jgi:type II secretory pathway pseudopilin PulG